MWRGLADSFDKGAGAARRVRVNDLAAGNCAALVSDGHGWAEGRATVVDGRLTFVSSTGESRAIVITGHRTLPGSRWRLTRARGLGLARVHEVEIVSEGSVVRIAVGKRELPMLLAAIA